MKTLAVACLLLIMTTGCSNLRGMFSDSSGMASSGGAGHSRMDSGGYDPAMNNTVINPRTGQLTLYHGG